MPSPYLRQKTEEFSPTAERFTPELVPAPAAGRWWIFADVGAADRVSRSTKGDAATP